MNITLTHSTIKELIDLTISAYVYSLGEEASYLDPGAPMELEYEYIKDNDGKDYDIDELDQDDQDNITLEIYYTAVQEIEEARAERMINHLEELAIGE